MPSCPTCTSKRTVKNGWIHTGKQHFLCRSCGCQFRSATDMNIEHPTHKVIDAVTRELGDRLLLEPISMAGIAQAVQVSEQWLQDYVNLKAAHRIQEAQVRPQKRGPLRLSEDKNSESFRCS